MAQLIVFYDEGCENCLRIAGILKKIVKEERIIFKKALEMEQYTSDQCGLQNRYYDLFAVSNEETFSGYDTYLQIVKRIPLLSPLNTLLQNSLVRFIGEKVYRFIADRRSCHHV
ncbi:MAG: DUF393 domain-containing protein [SAR324 cluster bacterium]|nr:DUF393 domain-containing protein [SAR324 cluster bacterium]